MLKSKMCFTLMAVAASLAFSVSAQASSPEPQLQVEVCNTAVRDPEAPPTKAPACSMNLLNASRQLGTVSTMHLLTDGRIPYGIEFDLEAVASMVVGAYDLMNVKYTVQTQESDATPAIKASAKQQGSSAMKVGDVFSVKALNMNVTFKRLN